MNDEMTAQRETPASASDATRVYLGEQRVKGVVFVPAPAAQPAPHRLHDTRRRDVLHVSTDDLTRTAHIRRALVEQIAEAKQKVLFCSFLFVDEEIVRALCEAAERLHGGVYVLTALGKHLRAEVLEPNSDVDANTAKLQDRAKRHEDHLQRLAHAGVWLRSAEDCHAKFCVVDDACAIVTSANATQEAYESNPEDGLIVLDSQAARELGRLFAHVWQYLSTLESTPGARLDVRSLTSARALEWRALAGADALRPVTTLRSQEASLRDAAIEVIDRAKDHLAIATYSFMGVEEHPIGAALARALARNVRLDLLVQPRNHIDAQRASLAWLVGLAPERVRLYGHRRTHTKSIVADGQAALLWTGNLEARHGWDNGIEVGVLVEDAGVASAVVGWTGDVMRRATHFALNTPTVRELVDAGQPPALAGEWTVKLPAGAQKAAAAQVLSRNPVELLEVQGALVLRCGDEMLFDIRVDEASRRIDVVRTRRVEGLMGSRSKGWLATTVLHVVAAPPPPPSQGRPPQQQPQQRRRSKGRRR
ncbi:phosphatidylserine/phosphatidylglycerophosphate/cardiolipin synthase family protein [Corallococcus sp. EGB]|uniref:phospholipase D-like domain-containing protein n=1 Tax=Corallococcus sp. EGB TaxID=1521117 RepID=UPI001CBD4A7B|nr:phospholipase D-like domain-containing protein [Corallococcus sp. EGB]